MKDIKGETFNNEVTPPKPKNVRDYERPKLKDTDMNFFKKFIVKRALPFILSGIDVNIDVDKDEDINVLSYNVKVTLFGEVIFSKEGAEVF